MVAVISSGLPVLKQNVRCAGCYDEPTQNYKVNIYKSVKLTGISKEPQVYLFAYHEDCGPENKKLACLNKDFVFEKMQRLNATKDDKIK